ncbi:MAG TPA: hypothetical protein VMB19_07115 [Silvibacterium sp.]|nr:hypothetical protein [Silvibacterium sp.]
MTSSRREFLCESFVVGLLPVLAPNSILANAAAQAPQEPTVGEDYWRNLFASSEVRGSATLPDTDREPRFLHYAESTGLRWAEDIKASELPSFDDDAVITMELSGLRTGSEDHSRLAKVKFSQLHLSCQRITGSEFLGPIVWAALATVFTDKASKIPSSPSLSWSALTRNPTQPGPKDASSASSPLNHVVLNHGSGSLTVAVTTTPADSLLNKILAVTINTAKIVAPLLGFPGIALPALENFYTFYGQLEQSRKENFLLNSTQKDVVVTQRAAASAGDLVSRNAMKLLSGEYILVPKSQEEDFAKAMPNLTVQNGFVVQQNATGAPDARIADAVPTVSYLTVSVKVQAASTFPATENVTDPLLDAEPQGAGKEKKKTGTSKPS